jgi:hypothetical protein
MSTALDLVFKYRTLVGKCLSDSGLDIEEIQVLTTLEQLFRSRESRREFARVDVDLKAELRARGMRDSVAVSNIAPGGVVCGGCPYLQEGDAVEIVIENSELLISYRFSATVAWTQYDENDDMDVGLEFVGVPLLIRRRVATQPELVAQVAA